MRRLDKRLLAGGIALVAGGILLALSLDSPLARYAIGISAFAVGLGLLRRAFRVE